MAAPVPTSSASLDSAAQRSRSLCATANSLSSAFEQYAARPNNPPTPLLVQGWIGQTARLLQQSQDLLALLVEMQVEALDTHSQRRGLAPMETTR